MKKKLLRFFLFLTCVFLHTYTGYLSAQSLQIFPTRVSLYSGSGAGFRDSILQQALFDLPTGVAADTFGNVYVADFNNHRIRKISPSGLVTTLAGNGIAGYVNGQDTAARFNKPTGIACDLAGNVYVADQWNHTIRKITPGGLVSTFAGTGNIGSNDGATDTARFNFPTGVAFDLNGNLFVADQYNYLIRKITPSGIVSTYAGIAGNQGYQDGSLASALFRLPTGISCDAAGNVYVADYSNHVIRKIDLSQITTTYAGTGSFGYKDTLALFSGFSTPSSVFADVTGDVYVADKGNQMIRRITPNGWVQTVCGSYWGNLDATGTKAQFSNPYSLVRTKSGEFVVADANNHSIRMLNNAVINTFITSINSPSSAQNITIQGRGLSGPVRIIVPAPFEVSLLEGNFYNDTLDITVNGGELMKDIFIRANYNIAGNYNVNGSISASGATPVSFSLSAIINCGVPVNNITPYNGAVNLNVGVPFSQTFSQSTYQSPVWRLGGSIPSGISIDSLTGVLHGTPANAGSFIMSITTHYGVCSQSTNYTMNVSGTALAMFGYDALSCNSRDVQFRDSSVLDTSWFWNFGDGTFSTLQNPFHIYAKDSTYRVTLSINGIGLMHTRDVKIVSYPPVPLLSYTQTCNHVYTFTGAPAGNDYKYYWSFDAGSTGNGDSIQTPNRQYNFNGSTTVTLAVIAGGMCVSQSAPLVFMADSHTVGVTAAIGISAPANNLCLNQRILTNNSSGSGNQFMYSLDGAGFNTITAPVNLSGLAAGNHSLKLAANDNFCFDTATQNFIIADVITAFTSTPSTCNQNVTFNNGSTSTFGSLSYLWNFGSPVKDSSILTNPVYNFVTPANDSTQLTATAQSGCSKTLKQLTTVGTNLGPQPDFTISQDAAFCKNRFRFNNTTTNPTGATWLWNFGDGNTSALLSPTHAFADTGYFNVSLTVTTSTCSLIVSKPVHVTWGSSGPVARFATNPASQNFPGNQFQFQNQSIHIGSGYTVKYRWDFGDGTLDSTNTHIYGKHYNTWGDFTVTLTSVSSSGCVDVEQHTVTLTPVLQAYFGFTSPGCSSRNYQFKDSSALATSWHWNFGDGDTSNIQNPLHTFRRDSIYTVTLTVNGTQQYSRILQVASTPVMDTIRYTLSCNNHYTFTGAPTGYGMTYRWNLGGGSGGDTTAYQPSCYYTSSGTRVISLTATSLGTCSANAPALVLNADAVLNAIQASFQLSSPGNNHCANSRTIINTSSGGTTYTYSLDNGPYLPISGTVTLNDLSVGYHQVKVKADNATCSVETWKGFFISTVTASFTSLPSTCNQVVNFTNTSITSDNNGYTSQWIFGSPAKDTSYDQSPAYNFGTPGADSAMLIVTSSSGCSAAIKSGFMVGNGTTTLVSAFNVTSVSGNCNNKFKFTDASTGSSTLAYDWDFGDGTSSALKNPVKSFADTGWFKVRLTINQGTCYSTSVQNVHLSSNAVGPMASFRVNYVSNSIVDNAFNYVNESSNMGPGYISGVVWKFGDGTADSSYNSYFGKKYTQPGTYQVTLIVTSSLNCIDSTVHPVTVTPIPVSNFGYNINSCTDRTVSFIDSSVLASSYLWDFGDGTATSTQANPLHKFDADGLYDVTLTINGGVVSHRNVLVATYPKATYTYSQNNCGNKYKFHALDSGSTYTYLWRASAGTWLDSTGAEPTLQFSSTVNSGVTLLVVSGGRCNSQSPVDTVYAKKGVIASFIVQTTDSCSTDRTLVNTGTGGTGWWADLDQTGFSTFSTTQNYTNLTMGYHTLTTVGTDGTCYDTATASFYINTIIGDYTSQVSNCEPAVNFSSNFFSGDASSINYLWNFNNEGTSTEPSPGFLFSSAGKKPVRLDLTINSGCHMVFLDTFTVKPKTGPVSTFTYSEVRSTPCQSGYNFISTSPNGTQFYWSYGDNQVSGQSTQKSAFHAYQDTGYYKAWMIAIDAMGCETISDTSLIHVTFAAKPSPIVLFSSSDSVACFSLQNTTFLNASSLQGAGYIEKFIWSFGNGTWDSVSTSVYGFRYDAVGNYTVVLKARSNLGCESSYSRNFRVIDDSNCVSTGVIEQKAFAGATLYPNPGNGSITIHLNSPASELVHVSVVDMLGRNCAPALDILPGQLNLNMNLNLQAGTYYIILSNAEGKTLKLPYVLLE